MCVAATSSSDASSLAVLLDHARHGDSVAEAEIYERYARRLIRLAASRIALRFQSKFDPDDIVQSVFQSFFWRHQNGQLRFASWSDLWSFLARVTVRKCHRHARRMLAEKRSLNREVAFDHWQESEPGPREIAAPDCTPEDIAEFDEILTQLLDGLSPIQQRIVELKMQGYSNLDISKTLKRSERTVYRLLGTLRERMRLIEAESKI